MRKLRRKFPANFSDLLFIGFIAWCVADLGHLISDVYVWQEKVLPGIMGILIAAAKFLLGMISIAIRVRYNHRSNG